MRRRGAVPEWHRRWWYREGVRLSGERGLWLGLWVTKPWRLIGPALWVSPAWVDGVADPWVYLSEGAEAVLDKGSKGIVGPGAPCFASEKESEKKWPTLWQYLTQTVWADGSERKTAGLSLWMQDGMFKACLRDSNDDTVLFTTAPGLLSLLGSLEMALTAPQPDWRRDRKAGGGGAKKGR